ncbi:MAG TPA: Uma2 family endonuclease, partial [Tepidisphaeraceae bacterium]
MSAVEEQIGLPLIYREGISLYRLSVAQYHAMIQHGLLTSDDKVELIEGLLIPKMPKNPPDRICNERLGRAIRKMDLGQWSFQKQEPITLLFSEPEPDGSIFAGVTEDYELGHPQAADVAVVMEVSDSTLHCDRSLKLRDYARSNIPFYWIINLIDRRIEVYSQPDATGDEPLYRTQKVYGPA